MKNEFSFVNTAWRRLANRKTLSACREVPLLGRAIDLALEKEGAVFAFEFKLRDWRRALVQARDHRLAVDYAYICMPKRAVPDVMRTALLDSGVGLAFYSTNQGWPFEIVVEAPKSTDVWPAAREALLRYLRHNSNQSR